MRPNCCCTALQVSILLLLVLTSNADVEDSGCTVGIHIRRHTAMTVFLGKSLTICCGVSFCSSAPEMIWYKQEETLRPIVVSNRVNITWVKLNCSEGILFLIFKETLSSDSGLYQCQNAEGSAMSHSINITVTDDPFSPPRYMEHMWSYMCSAAGILVFVTIVIIITVVSKRGCKGKSKTETPRETQQVIIPRVEEPFPHRGIQPSSRESPSIPPSHRSQLKKSPQQNNQVHGKVKGDRKKKRNAAEEGSCVVYTTVNHQLPSAITPQPRGPQEVSEYATIRVA